MDIYNYLFVNISALDPIVKYPGVLMIVFFALRGLVQVFSLNFIRAITNMLYALVLALVLARFGQDISAYLRPFVESI